MNLAFHRLDKKLAWLRRMPKGKPIPMIEPKMVPDVERIVAMIHGGNLFGIKAARRNLWKKPPKKYPYMSKRQIGRTSAVKRKREDVAYDEEN